MSNPPLVKTSRFNRWLAARARVVQEIRDLRRACSQHADSYEAAIMRTFSEFRSLMMHEQETLKARFCTLNAQTVELNAEGEAARTRYANERAKYVFDRTTAGPEVVAYAERNLRAITETAERETNQRLVRHDEIKAQSDLIQDRLAMIAEILGYQRPTDTLVEAMQKSPRYDFVREKYPSYVDELVATFRNVTTISKRFAEEERRILAAADDLRPRSFAFGDHRFVPQVAAKDDEKHEGKPRQIGVGLYFDMVPGAICEMSVQTLLQLRDWINEVFEIQAQPEGNG